MSVLPGSGAGSATAITGGALRMYGGLTGSRVRGRAGAWCLPGTTAGGVTRRAGERMGVGNWYLVAMGFGADGRRTPSGSGSACAEYDGVVAKLDASASSASSLS